MDWSAILQVLRDALTIIGVGKLVHSGYRQIKKNLRFQRTGKNSHNNVLYKKVFGVRYKEQSVRHGLQKKSNIGGIPLGKVGIPFSKKASVDKILSASDRILFTVSAHDIS